MAQGPEARLVDKMRKTAKAHYGERLVIIKYHGSAYSQAGVSDLLCCLDGVFVAAEVKAPESYGNNETRAVLSGASKKQTTFLNQISFSGGEAAVVASVEGFMRLLEAAAEKAHLLRRG